MKRDSRLAGSMCAVAVVLSALAWAPARASAAPGLSRDDLTFTLTAEQSFSAPTSLESRTARLPGPEDIDLDKAAPKTIPTFTHSVVARGTTYKVTLVGSDPFVKNAPRVVVPMQIVPVRFELDGTVFDPSLPSPSCAGGGSAVSRLMESPLVQTVNYGEGKRQYHEEIRRLEFWSLTGAPSAINRGYSVRLAASVAPTVTVKLSGAQVLKAACGQVGFVNVNAWDDLVKTQILPALHSQGVGPRTFPLFVMLNIWLYDGNPDHCCVFGYHNAFNAPDGVQTYAVADYDISQTAKTFTDVSELSHEIAEWYDDPFSKNPTPSWGHVGLATECEENLDVAVPLSGSLHPVTMANGFTYHPQEIAFFSWFYNQTPSLGFKGWYSSGGTFRTPARLCQ